MRRILTRHKAHTIFLGLVNRQLHTIRPNIQAQTQITIYQRRSFRLLEYVNGFVRPEYALVNAVAVDWFEPSEAVGVNAAFVCFDEDLGGCFGLFGRAAVGEEYVFHELLHVFKVDYYGCFFFCLGFSLSFNFSLSLSFLIHFLFLCRRLVGTSIGTSIGIHIRIHIRISISISIPTTRIAINIPIIQSNSKDRLPNGKNDILGLVNIGRTTIRILTQLGREFVTDFIVEVSIGITPNDSEQLLA
mmetsp:Transcript_6645/g.10094  ORF Transcript_6645/g.10094 Transcript_6645/m.10094 type:complete len:245 (+) Transcript_6645:1034-1768(+)